MRRRGLTVPCDFCGRPVNTTLPGAYVKCSGYAPIRDAGGANTIALRQDIGGAAHGACVRMVSSGAEQTSLA